MKKRPHYDVIIAWANGVEVEMFNNHSNKWKVIKDPCFLPEREYRVKPLELVVGNKYWYSNTIENVYRRGITYLGKDIRKFDVFQDTKFYDIFCIDELSPSTVIEEV